MEAEGAVADQADLAVEAFEAAVGEAEADGGEDAVAVLAQGAGEADERPAAGSGWPRPARRRGARAPAPGRAGGRAAGALRAAGRRGRARRLSRWTSASVASWPMRLVLGRLEQRPAGALDPAAGRGVGALVARSIRRGGPGRWRAAPSRTTWNGSKQISASRDGVADRALVLAAHVDRDRPDRVLAVAELVEEAPAGWRCCGPARTTRSRPCGGRRPRSGSGDGGDR